MPLPSTEPALPHVGSERSLGRVSEYLIRTETGDWPAIHADRLAAALAPDDSDCEPMSGWGDLRLRCGAATAIFSGEPVGWQVIIEGGVSEDQADGLVQRFTERVSAETGETCNWIRIG